jgi:hypothetical protein
MARRPYFAIVNVTCFGADFGPVGTFAVITSVYLPSASLCEPDSRPWKETLFVPL